MTTITIRNVPQQVRNELAARAARAGKSMQEYLKGELERMVSLPTREQLMDRVRARVQAGGVVLSAEEIVADIHEARREHEEAIDAAIGSTRGRDRR